MKEFMLYIRNQVDLPPLPEEVHQRFLKKCEIFIAELKRDGKLVAAQPIVREGKILSLSEKTWKEGTFKESPEVMVGYYHILAADLDEATAIAKRNPEFEFKPTARIEIRPIKMKEDTTGFVYPKS